MNINCKVRINSKNGQMNVNLPKRIFKVKPDAISLKVPKRFINEEFLFKKMKGGMP